MRIAHWSIWAPHRSGMYHTTADLVLGEQALGIDAALIDAVEPVEKTDGRFHSASHRFADTADIYMLHLAIPEPYMSDGTPVIVALHGHPLYSMQIELYGLEPGNDRPFSTVLSYLERTGPTWFVSFWEYEQSGYWSALDGVRDHPRVRYIPRGIRYPSELAPEGPKRNLEGSPVIVIADQFRLFKDALPALWGAYEYWLRNPAARVHLYGLPPRNSRAREALERWIGGSHLHRCIGGMHDVVDYLPEVLRSADVLLSTVTGESRLLLEAQACGCPVVAPTRAADICITDFWLPHRVADGIAHALDLSVISRKDRAETVRSRYDISRTVAALSSLYEEVLDHAGPQAEGKQ